MSAMRRLLACVSAVLVLASPVLAEATPPGSLVSPFVWRLVAPGASPGEVDHLIGTMHVPLGPREFLPPPLVELLRRAEGFTMEVDLARVSAAAVAHWTRHQQPQALKRALGPADWATLARKARAVGLEPASLEGYKAWYVSLLLVPTQAEAGRLMDSCLRREAEAGGAVSRYLETPDDQFQALDAVSDAEDLKQLREALHQPDSLADEAARIEHAYRRGDLAAIEQDLLASDRLAAYPDFYEQVFWARNRRWLPVLEEQARQQRLVAAVGLGHLLGPKGLLASLAARGWQVTRWL
ncbi:MAG: TraB/GumN family protein [Candidatus Sericytochromatia bacterium]|nr:TraB/GumN family protein [Candidatus Sericytochromatia bacterium]